jgi:hypothetical protein
MRDLSSLLNASDREDGYKVAIALNDVEHALLIQIFRALRGDGERMPDSMSNKDTVSKMLRILHRRQEL